MMTGDSIGAFAEAYARLNNEQKRAVDTIDGPMLVLAGPGTGKTQLLSARVANTLQRTDTLPQNILCLTFTESGAANMRERLTRFIGKAAYDVPISTYHAFGGELIRRFPEYFADVLAEAPIDELGKHRLLQNIVEKLSYRNPLRQTQHHLGDLIATISEVKRALLGTKDLRAIAAENMKFIHAASRATMDIFADFTTMPRKLDKALPYFERTRAELQTLVPRHSRPDRESSKKGASEDRSSSDWIPDQAREDDAHAWLKPLAEITIAELAVAIESAKAEGKTKPLTAWKNSWLAKNADNQFVLAGELENRRIDALAGVFETYQDELAKHGWYDFDDMILRAIKALAQNADLRFSLHEQYLYILLDEFQDTNAAQLRLVELLTDNPVHEGRPNVMAVGDDDQAIYAFQGAQYSNMRDFFNLYRDVTLVNLTKNYRSHADVLYAARGVAEQIGARLQHHFPDISKTLEATHDNLPAARIERCEFLSDIAEADWIAERIEKLIKAGVPAHEIGALAPAHKYLTALVPYLNARTIPVHYEKRENILEAPVVQEIVTMSRLVLALAAHDERTANALWPAVLSFAFWQFPISDIWQISWQLADDKHAHGGWSQALLERPVFRQAALLFLALAQKTEIETCETMLDYLIGSEAIETHEPDLPHVQSPLRHFYTGEDIQRLHPERLYETLTHLTIVRARLREHQAMRESALKLADLVDFIDLYQAAGQPMLNTNPYHQQADAVQLMTVFKAKGLEFQHVFLPNMHDAVWGSSARGGGNKLTLPANLSPIRHAGASEDERLRILFVALTRAKSGLYLTSSTQNYAGKATKRLKYLNEQEQADGTFKSIILPEHTQTIMHTEREAPKLELLELDWRTPHFDGATTTVLQGLLTERLKNYQLSPTHLNTFTDVVFGGPQKFFMSTLLRFPQAPTTNTQFGNAMHETLEWLQNRIDGQGSTPTKAAALKYFEARLLAKKLTSEQAALELERGQAAIAAYLGQLAPSFRPGDKAEFNFRNEGVFAGDARLAGKIDRMVIDKTNKTITVVDYKTGRSFDRWASDARLHKYRQQLYCYKLLIEGSHTFAGYQVAQGRLEFVEPDADNHIRVLDLRFKNDELQRTKKLLEIMWQHVMQLNFPDVSVYPTTLAGIREFEQDLLEGKV